MKEEKTAVKSSAVKENEPVIENGKKKSKEEKPPTKIVVRRLPPTMSEDQFKMQVSPLPDHDYFYFVSADMSLMPNAFSRAYINFINQSDLFIFTEKFDGYVFIDSKGGEFPAIVEFAPFQRIPKNRPNRKKDPKVGTIEADPAYIAFKEQLEAEILENKTSANVSKQHFFETCMLPEAKEINNTPLLDFVKNRRAERQRIREEKREEKRKKDLERRRAKEEQRRTKKEDDTSVIKDRDPSLVHPTPKNPDQPSVAPVMKSELQKNNPEDITPDSKNEADISTNNKVVKQCEVNEKVHELFIFFNKSFENVKRELEKSNDFENNPLNVIQHKDVEKEIIQNIVDRNEMKTNSSETCQGCPFENYCRLSYPVQSHYHKSNSVNTYDTSSPILKSHVSVFMPQSITTCVQNVSDIIMKPVKITNPNYKNFIKRSDSKMDVGDILMKPVKIPVLKPIAKGADTKVNGDDEKKSLFESDFAEDVFRKNLKRVVEDVLGNATVSNPKENVISKPKIFINRGCVGSGEQCERSGFNSPNFYLPPRAFGCGPSESANVSKECSHYNKNNCVLTPKPLKTICPGKGYLPTFRTTLPPFSRKSNGDIEKYKIDMKLGGSQESLRRRIDSWAFEEKPGQVRRPHLAPKQSIIPEKTCEVAL